MEIPDEDLAQRWLRTVGYYRLSIYWLPFECPPKAGRTRSRVFKAGTRFEDVRDIYVFDRELRLLAMEAIERVEVAVRARWTNRLSLTGGAHAYLDASNFADRKAHLSLLGGLTSKLASSRETFVEHYLASYDEPAHPPLWVVTEVMEFGTLSRWVKATADPTLKDELARDVGLPNREVLTGVLEALTYVRNVCAHHGRLWNRQMVKYVPRIKRLSVSQALDRAKGQGTTNTVYNALTVLAHMLVHQSSDTSWPNRVRDHVASASDQQRRAMGFPQDWQTRPVWVPRVAASAGGASRAP